VPLFDRVRDLAAANRSGGLVSNREHFGPHVEIAPELDEPVATVLFDPQTSGGLLIAAAPDSAGAVAAALAAAGAGTWRIGRVEARREPIRVRLG
jgi:selenide,water dikinase